MKISISESEYSRMVFGLGSPGVCLSCGMIEEYAGCELDASNYECPECGELSLMGLEEALFIYDEFLWVRKAL